MRHEDSTSAVIEESTEASATAHPRIASRDEWLAARKELLTKEKAVTKHRDRVSAERRRLPRAGTSSKAKRTG